MINKYSNIPLYSQLKDLIIEKIQNGDYQEDTKIPSEQELCETYNISRPTVRQAISELTNNGYLYKEKGKGTFVSKRKSTIDIKNYTGFSDSILDCQEPGEKDIIYSGVTSSIGNAKLEEIFGLPKDYDSDFAVFKYPSKHNKEVYAISVSYIPLSLFPSILEDIREKKSSFEILRGKYPLLPDKSRSTMEVIFMDNVDAQYLQVQTGQALINIDNVLLSKSGQVVEYVVTKYRADKCKLVFETSK